MSAKKPGRGVDRKGRSKKGGKFVRLGDGMLTSEAWRSLSGSAIKFYVELRRRFNGQNNGDLHLSLDEAKIVLKMSKNTARKAQRELAEKGFIRLVRPGGFNQRAPSLWALTDEATIGETATHDYKRWEPPKKIPRFKYCTPNGSDTAPLNSLNEFRGAETIPKEPDSNASAVQKLNPF